jgi:hypothetical protein
MFWRRRPHWIPADYIVFVTWHLAGTLPFPEPANTHQRLSHREDTSVSGSQSDHDTTRGPRWLEKPAGIVRWVKAASAVRANRLTGRTGQPFWQTEYFYTWMRPSQELASVIAYVEENPALGRDYELDRSRVGHLGHFLVVQREFGPYSQPGDPGIIRPRSK